MDRRKFLESILRYGLLAALLLVSGFLVRKHAKDPDPCQVNPFCRNCGQLADCHLPQALKEKDHGKE